jgi:UDP-glucose 4-epimerase
MYVVITGGAGFIGSRLAIYLKGHGYKVTCIDNLSRASKSAIKALEKEKIPLIISDIRETNKLLKIFKGSDVVIHAAALISVEESIKDPLLYLDNNATGTASVTKACIDASVRRLIYLSSAAVYGEPIKLPIDEDHPTNPLSPYGLSKLFGEEIIKTFSRLYSFDYIILRLFNVYGPRQSEEYAGVITKFINRVREKLPPIIFGDGEQTRDFIHVSDVCHAIELAITTKNTNNVYNIGSGTATKIKELARLIINIANINSEPIYSAPKPGDIKQSYANINKARKLLNFTPRISLEKGLKELIQMS